VSGELVGPARSGKSSAAEGRLPARPRRLLLSRFQFSANPSTSSRIVPLKRSMKGSSCWLAFSTKMCSPSRSRSQSLTVVAMDSRPLSDRMPRRTPRRQTTGLRFTGHLSSASTWCSRRYPKPGCAAASRFIALTSRCSCSGMTGRTRPTVRPYADCTTHHRPYTQFSNCQPRRFNARARARRMGLMGTWVDDGSTIG
jgi:hypothetical protein